LLLKVCENFSGKQYTLDLGYNTKIHIAGRDLIRISNSYNKKEIVIFGDQYQILIDNIDEIEASIQELKVFGVGFLFFLLSENHF